MIERIYCVLFWALISILNQSADCKDFCVAFRENNHRISYTFRRVFDQPLGPTTKHDIIINGHYWRIDFTDEDRDQLVFEDPKHESKESPFFSGDYSMAACVRTQDRSPWRYGKAFLFNKNDWKYVSIGDIPNDSYDQLRQLSEYKLEKKKTMVITETTDPKFAFSYDEFGYRSELVFVEPTVDGFKFKAYIIEEDVKLKTEYLRSKTFLGLKALASLSTSTQNHELIAIMPQWGFQPQVYGLLLLFRDHQIISWCWTQGSALDIENCIRNPQVLANCSVISTEKPTEDETQDENKILIVIILVFLAILSVIILIAIAVFLCNKKSGEVEETADSHLTGVPTGPTKRTPHTKGGSKYGAQVSTSAFTRKGSSGLIAPNEHQSKK